MAHFREFFSSLARWFVFGPTGASAERVADRGSADGRTWHGRVAEGRSGDTVVFGVCGHAARRLQFLTDGERSVRPDGATGCSVPQRVKKVATLLTHNSRRERAYTHGNCDARVACGAVTCGEMNVNDGVYNNVEYHVREFKAKGKK